MSFKNKIDLRSILILCLNLFIASLSFAHETPEGIVTPPPIDGHTAPQESPKDSSPLTGASLFSTCYYCHSLKSNVHLTGPSLAGLWGKKAGKVKGYELYSETLKKSNIIWNEKTLAEWLLDPQKVAPDTAMPNVKISEENIKSLVEFLKIAMSKGGYEKVVSDKLISERIASGQLPKYSRVPDKTSEVKAIESCGQTYSIEFADGSIKKIWKFNLAFKIMQGELAPKEKLPVIVPTGSMGDRFEIVFRSLKELSSVISECKSK